MCATIVAMFEPSVLVITAMRRTPSSRRIMLGPWVNETVANDDSGTAPDGVSSRSRARALGVRSTSPSRITTSKRRPLSMICDTVWPLAKLSSTWVMAAGVTPNSRARA
jgi:hypothetical protein